MKHMHRSKDFRVFNFFYIYIFQSFYIGFLYILLIVLIVLVDLIHLMRTREWYEVRKGKAPKNFCGSEQKVVSS